MSEYWKSTPKSWCKHCKIYVRDSPLEKTQHESSPRHQGNLKRFLGELHKGHQREEREKLQAKAEVARLNGLVGGSTSSLSTGTAAPLKAGLPPVRAAAAARAAKEQESRVPATIQDRKNQMEQLATLGVAIPDQYRAQMAMAGDWVTTSTVSLDDKEQKPAATKAEDSEENNADEKGGTALDYRTGFKRKRAGGLDRDEDEAFDSQKKKGWGKTFKDYPTSSDTRQETDDLDELFSRAKKSAIRQGDDIKFVKAEDAADSDSADMLGDTIVKTEDDQPVTTPADEDTGAVMFKKRKPKAQRQR